MQYNCQSLPKIGKAICRKAHHHEMANQLVNLSANTVSTMPFRATLHASQNIQRAKLCFRNYITRARFPSMDCVWCAIQHRFHLVVRRDVCCNVYVRRTSIFR